MLVAGTIVLVGVSLTLTFKDHGPNADDAWMFIRYADHLLADHSVAWNPGGVPTFGVTSPLHLVLVTALRAIGLSQTSCLIGATAVPAALLCLLWVVLSSRNLKDRPVRLLVALVLLIYWVNTASLRIHLTSGMDTLLGVFATFMLFEAARNILVSASKQSAHCFVAVSVAALATRPELAIFVVGQLIVLLWACREQPRFWVRSLLLPLVAAGVVATGALWAYFGWPIPLPFYAKVGSIYGQLPAFYAALPWQGLKEFFYTVAPLLAFLVVFPPRRYELALLAVPAVVFVPYCFRITWIMGYEGRFLMPLVGSLLAAVGAGLERKQPSEESPTWAPEALLLAILCGGLLWPLTGRKSILALFLVELAAPIFRQRRLLAAAMGATALLAVDFAYQRTRELVPPLERQQAFLVSLSREVARLPDDLRIAATEHGYLGAQNPRKEIMDLAGLHDPVFARGFNADRLFSEEPDLVVMPRWVYRQMIERIVADPRYKRDYVALDRTDRSIGAACAKEGIGVAVRRSSPYAALLTKVIRDAAAEASDRRR